TKIRGFKGINPWIALSTGEQCSIQEAFHVQVGDKSWRVKFSASHCPKAQTTNWYETRFRFEMPH
ncbi:MAG: hypothetical protein VXW32_04125, partial [Myxococcota bacterium]|nr:hypothetical protein [Myxococcota bacterium]